MHNIIYNNVMRSIIKIAFVLCVFLVAASVEAATLSVSPSTGVYTAGQTFTARVVVNTAGDTINAAEGTLSFNPAELSVVRVTKGSIFNLWTSEPSFSNTAGTITFSGGATPPGYKGSSGTALNVTFRIKNAGAPRVSFKSGAVLAADGRGTNVLTGMSGGSYTIAAQETVPESEVIEYVAPANTPARPEITSSSHPDQNGWYATTQASLSWSLPSDVTAVRTLLDGSASTIPTKLYDTPIREITLQDLDEGVQYFHLQFRNADGWGRVAHYRLAVDTVSPENLQIALAEGADLSNPAQTLVLSVDGEVQPIDRYLVQIDGAEPYEYIDEQASGTIALAPLEPGYHSVIIEAFDAAGNSTIATFSFGILAFDKPQFTQYPSELTEDVIPVINGITRPNADVIITLQKVGSDPQEKTVQSDETGAFIFIPEGRFSVGVYELSAVAIDEYGARSEVSQTVRIAVQEPGYIRIGTMMISLLSIFIPLLALLALLIIGVWWLVLRFRKMTAGVARESSEALGMLHTEFVQLRSVLSTQEESLRASRKTKKLTKAETALVAALHDELSQAEEKVAKEIADVEKIVS